MTAAARDGQPAVSDAYLVARAQDGYIDAYELLVRRHSAVAYRVALRLTGNHHDAQDVAQEALIAAWQNLAGFRAGSSFPTWLYQIVTRRALNKIRHGRASAPAELLPAAAGPAGEPAVQPSVTWPPMRSPTRWARCRSRSGPRSSFTISRDCPTLK